MAFNINLGSLSISIGADTEGFEKGMKTVKKKLKEGGTELRKSVNQWGKWAAAASVAAAAVAAAVIKSNLTAIRELKNVAAAANTTVAEFQRGAFAAQQFGIEQEKYGDILKDVNDRIGDFITTGAGPMVDFFEQIAPKVGVTIDQFKKLSGQEALGLYVDSLKKANLSQAEMTFFMEAMASDSTRLIPLFENNSKAMKKMTAKAKALGIGLSQIDVANAIAAQAELDKMAFVLDNDIKKAVADLAPFITATAKELQKLAADAGGFGTVAITAFEGVGNAVALVGNAVRVFQLALKGLKVIGLGVTSVITEGFRALAEGVTGIGNTILEGWRLIFKEMGNLAGALSDDAKAIFDSMAEGIDGLKGKVPDLVTDIANSQLEALALAKTEMQALAMEEIPTQSFEKFINKVKDATLVAAQEVKGGQVEGQTSTIGAVDTDEKSESDRIREENQKILEALLEEGMLREETLLGRIERERTIVDEAMKNELISRDEHQRAMNAIDEKESRIKTQIISSTLDAAVQALSVGGKKATKVQKALAITNAVIKGKEAAVDAWQAGMSVGGPFAPLAAAAYTAASIARTAGMIRSISSGGKSVGGGGGSVSIPSRSAPESSGQEQGGGIGDRRVRIDLVGDGAQLFTGEQVRSIIGQINEQTGDGVELAMTTGG